MAGRFEGLTDLEWKLFEDIFAEEPSKRGKGRPHTPYRYVLNSLLYILITGCRWCDIPQGGTLQIISDSDRILCLLIEEKKVFRCITVFITSVEC